MKILEVNNLKVHFYTSGKIVKAVDDAGFDIEKGEVFGIVGESGSGKTLTALSILKLIPYPGKIADGKILFNGDDILRKDEEYLRGIRGSKIAMVFQEPSTSFDPVFTIGSQVVESVMVHQGLKKTAAEDTVFEYLKRVHISDPGRVFHDYPHQLSGGTKQRAMIAMALVNSPELLILDEPTTALDVTIQAQILDLLEEIIEKEKVSILFISHDLGIIARMCSRVAVMRKGKIVEMGERERIIHDPKDPYTFSLLEAVRALE